MSRLTVASILVSSLVPVLAVAQLDVEATTAIDVRYAALAPLQGRTITAVEIVGGKVTREHVVPRETRSRVGDVSAKAFFGGTTQYWAVFNWPWIGGDDHPRREEPARRHRRALLHPRPRPALRSREAVVAPRARGRALRRRRNRLEREPWAHDPSGSGGLGAGLRILTPVSEMVRLDVGWSPEGGFHFHFAGGSKPKRQRLR